MKRKSYLFDSHALLILFQQEKGFERVAGLLKKIRKEKLHKYINIINFGEIIYTIKRRFGNEYKIRALNKIHQMDFEILPAKDEIVLQAAEIKGERALSYCDCIAVATAITNDLIVVTGDPEFKEVEGTVNVFWVR